MRTVVRLALLAISVCLALPGQAHGCDCVNGGAPCKAFLATQNVFAGKVVQIAAGNNGLRVVSFEVSNVYRGSLGKTADIETGSGGGDCGYDFHLGQSYLVYSNPWPETQKLVTSICTRTRLLSEARDDLDYFSKVNDPALGAGIEGDIFQMARDAHNIVTMTGPMAGITITISGVSGRRTVVSRKDGHFQMWGLVAGSYRVSPILPDTYLKMAQTVRLEAQGCEEVRLLATPPPKKQ